MFVPPNIDSYIAPLTGLGIIVTAIIHPEGIAPFFQPAMRHMGNWLMGVIPGARGIRDAYRGPKGVMVKAFLAILVVGGAFFVYNAKFVEDVYLWVVIAAAILWAVTMVFSVAALGTLEPSFGEAGRGWLDWAKRFGPTALVGYVAGWLVWPIRVDTYSMLWMPLLGAGLALFVRSIYRRIRYPELAHAEPPPDDPPEPESDEPAEPRVAAEVV